MTMTAKFTITNKDLEKMSFQELTDFEKKIKNYKKENAERYEIEQIVHALSQASYYLDFVIKEFKKINQKYCDTQNILKRLTSIKTFLNKNFKEFTK